MLSSVRVPSLGQMRSGDYWRGLFTNKATAGSGTVGGYSTGSEFFGTFEVCTISLKLFSYGEIFCIAKRDHLILMLSVSQRLTSVCIFKSPKSCNYEHITLYFS